MRSFERLYALGSFTMAGMVIMNAYQAKQQLYTTCLYLATTKASMMVLTNAAFVLLLLMARIIKSIFLGTLRDIEVEHLTDKLWATMMDSLLMMTIFRDELNLHFAGLFAIFLLAKTFHWLAQDRVDYLQQTPQFSFFSHARIFSLMCNLLFLDIAFVYYAATVTQLFKVPNIMIFFGFEYLILVSTIICTISKYFLNIIDMRSEGRWESKGAYILYIEFFSDTFRLLVYILFFSIILIYYGIPLHIIRQLYFTFASFRKRVADVVRYRKATANMNARFPNASAEELRSAEMCIVCREEMTEGKKLPCGHILHMHCLRSWLERQQVCPICTTPVLQEEIPQQQQQIPNWNVPPPVWNGWGPPEANQQQAEINPEINGVEFAMHQIQLLQMQIAAMSQTVQNLQEYLVAMQRNPNIRPPNVENRTVEVPTTPMPEIPATPEVKREEVKKKEGKEEEGTNTTAATASPEPTREELRKRWAMKYSQEQSPK